MEMDKEQSQDLENLILSSTDFNMPTVSVIKRNQNIELFRETFGAEFPSMKFMVTEQKSGAGEILMLDVEKENQPLATV